jgi:hypothetical protein
MMSTHGRAAGSGLPRNDPASDSQLGDAKDPLNWSADNVFRSIDSTVKARITKGFEVEKERSRDEKSNENPSANHPLCKSSGEESVRESPLNSDV